MRKPSLFMLTAALFSIALGAFARTPLPPDSLYYYPIYDLGQRAVIFYENGIETLVLSHTFAGSADDFAWIIPTPQKPEVDKVSNSLFSSLQERTQRAFNQRGDIYPVPLMFDAMRSESFSGPTVAVEETKEIGYYETTVVSASDSQELIKWLKERGYTYPVEDSYLLEDYIRDKWHFTIVRVKPNFAGETVSAALRRGHSTPLKLTFNSGDIVYPLKLSKVKIVHDSDKSKPNSQAQENKIKQDPYYYDNYYRYNERFPVVIYVLTDHRQALNGFQTEYAGWITKDEIEKLTDASWISPKEKDYFLTKLTSSVERSAIDSDLHMKDSPNNKTVNAPNPNAVYWFWIVVAFSGVLTLGAVFLLIYMLRGPRSGA